MSQLGNTPKYTNAPVFSEVGDGSTRTFTLAFNPGTKNALLVFVGGTFQSPAAYELDFNQTTQTTKLIFTPAPAEGARVVAVGLGIRGIAGIPADGSVSSKSFSRSGVDLPSGSTCTTQATGDTSDKIASDSFVGNAITAHNSSVRPHGISDLGMRIVKSSDIEETRSILGIAANTDLTNFANRLGTAEVDIDVLQDTYIAKSTVDAYIAAKVTAMMQAHAFDDLIKSVNSASSTSVVGSIVWIAWNPVGPRDARPLSPRSETLRKYNGKDVYILADGRSFNAAQYPELAAKIPTLKTGFIGSSDIYNYRGIPVGFPQWTDNFQMDDDGPWGTTSFVAYVIAQDVPGWKAEFEADLLVNFYSIDRKFGGWKDVSPIFLKD